MIKLEYVLSEDIQFIVKAANHNSSAKFLFQWAGTNFQYPLTEEQLVKYLQKVNNEEGINFFYKAIDLTNNQIVAVLELGRIDYYNKSGKASKVLILDENTRGKGYGKAVLNEALRIAFEELGLHKISLGVFDFNVSAIKFYEKFGLTKEGLWRDARRLGDEYIDMYEMSILEDEWRALPH